MLRKLIILGVFAGTSASIPILYESNPDAVHALVKSGIESAGSYAEPAALNTMRPQASTQPELLSGRKVQLVADARGHFLADFKLNGRKVDALVDTGATVVAINLSTARRIGIQLQASDFVHTVSTANGTAQAAAVIIGRLEIGRILIEEVPAVVLDDRALSGTLIGMSFLNRLGKFQVENRTLLLVQ